ncbi:MAG TPA: protein kinase [Candidatus Sulfopaludibacter sp.]|nr:protein kinase [Candidatus Sulfopaludibacter sp.]
MLEAQVRRLLESDAEVQSRTAKERLPRFGVFQARELIGTGGMGAVYRATREDDIRQEVAVKVVGAVLWSAEMEQRFRREGQILAAIEHPHIAASARRLASERPRDWRGV